MLNFKAMDNKTRDLLTVTNALIFALKVDGKKDAANRGLIKEAEKVVKLFDIPDDINCKHGFYHVEEIAVVVCTDCKEILGRESDC